MHEESDGMNENDNNSSEVVILPEKSLVDDSLSDDHLQIREEPSDYERKLDEKLRDLGLYEDDMTINQKEELLAVVVISCETAEQEENKRQLIREYLEGAQSLEDEIEFSFQESAWLADEANLLCSSAVTQSKDAPSSSKAHTDISLDPQPSSSENQLKKQINTDSTKFRSRMGESSSDTKVAVTLPILQEQHSEKSRTRELLDRQVSLQRQKMLLDKSMNSWKPCMSPTDKPLSNFGSSKVRKKREKKVSSLSFEDKVKKYLATFERIASSFKAKRSSSASSSASSSRLIHLNKPFVLMHHGSLAKRVCKLDNYDYIIGVSENNQSTEESEENFIPCSTLTRAKSAFHRVKPSAHGRLLSFPDNIKPYNNSTKNVQSVATLHSERHTKSKQEKSKSPLEVILEDSCNQINDISHNNFSFPRGSLSDKHVAFNEDETNENNKKLPQFSDLRPELSKHSTMIAPSPVIKKRNSQTETSVKNNYIPCTTNSTKKPKKEETAVKPEKDYSSDSSSSLIDVETVVDDEIEDFLKKRRLTPGTHKSSCISSQNQSKKLKKNES